MDDMHVIVVGCGRVGAGLSVALVDAGHSVAVVDKQATAFRRLPPDWRGQTVVGFGFDRDDLERAGAKEAQALAAVTSGDNSNILTARIARETYEIPAVVARIYDPRRAEIYQRLGIPTVATVTWTTNQVMRRLFPDRAETEWSDPSEKVHLVERLLPDSWGGRRLHDLEEGGLIRLASISRAGVAALPTAGVIGQEGDLLHLMVATDGQDLLDERLASKPMEKI
ncbi:MAG TPA: TrkA family potassium uptake protein [Acidimicrobiales bacterium]|nr:TrkA family potassium uptake protein [Acidimicrobiales bacterium]